MWKTAGIAVNVLTSGIADNVDTIGKKHTGGREDTVTSTAVCRNCRYYRYCRYFRKGREAPVGRLTAIYRFMATN